MIDILDIIFVKIHLLFGTDGSAGCGYGGWRLELTDMYCRNKGIRPRVYVIRIVSHLDLRFSTSADPCVLVCVTATDRQCITLLQHGVKIIAG